MTRLNKKRILYIENGIGYGGAIICLRHLVRNLDKDRFEPMVVTGRDGAQYREISQEAKWKPIPDRRIDVINMRRRLADAHWLDKTPGLRAVANQILARLDDIVNFLPFFTSLLWTAWRFKPHLIHANNEPLCNRAAVLAGKLLGIPVICHVRGDQHGSLMMRWMFSLPTYFIAVSNWISEGIGRMGVTNSHRTYIYDGIELDKLDIHADGTSFRERYRIPPDAFAVGLVGLLIPWKGQRLFLEAMAILMKQFPNMTPVIVGGTPEECALYERELRTLAADKTFRKRAIFTGHVQSMAEVYNGLDVVVSASTLPEPLGTMIIECMAMARPLVAPNHGGALEMLEHEQTGLLFNPNDACDLAVKIKQFYESAELRLRLGGASRVKALATFSINEHVSRVQAVYEQVVTKNIQHSQPPVGKAKSNDQ